MGLLDDYLNEPSNQPAAKATTTNSSSSGSSLIDSYLNSGDDQPKASAKLSNSDLVPVAPMSGVDNGPVYVSKKKLDEIAKQPHPNPRDSDLTDAVKAYPSNLGKGIVQNFRNAGETIGSGMSDLTSNKPASGVGKVGLGLLSGLSAIPSAAIDETVSRPIANITGSEDIGNRAGFVAGSGIPFTRGAKSLGIEATSIPGKTVAAVANAIPVPSGIVDKLPKNVALRELVDKITSNGRDPQALRTTVDAMKADPRIGPADTSPAVLSMAQKLFTTEGDNAKNYLYSASKGRMANLPTDVTDAYDAAGGVPVNVLEKLGDLSTAAKKAGSDIINPALAASKPVNISNTLDQIDNVLKPGVLKIGDSVPLTAVKKELENIRDSLSASKEYDANDLHQFQAGLRKTATGLMKSADGSERQVGQALMGVRNNLVNDIDAAGPKIKITDENGVQKEVGQYKHGLSVFRDEKDVADAFRQGYEGVFSNSQKMENMPEFTEQWFKGLSDQEKQSAKEGARLAIRAKMGTSTNPSLAGTNLARSEFNEQKLRLLFGKQETDKLLADLDNTRAIKNTHSKLIENSQTAMRSAGDQAVALPVKGEGGSVLNYALPIAAEYGTQMMGQPGVGAVLGGAALVAKKIGSETAFKVKTALAKERNVRLAKYALPTEGPDRDALIQQLDAIANAPPKMSMLRKVSSAVKP